MMENPRTKILENKGGSIVVPAEAWGAFGEVLYVLNDYNDAHSVGNNKEIKFDYRVGVDIGQDSLIVVWSLSGDIDRVDKAIKYIKDKIEEINKTAERPIQEFDGAIE